MWDIFVLCSFSLFFYIRFGYCFCRCVRCVLSNVLLLLLQYICLFIRKTGKKT
ncbi:hypothetical protein V8E52_003671 [Russula decolorans]